MARRRMTFDPSELAKGREVEREHVDEPSFAEEIARDHLREHPRYYSRLEECDVEGTRGSCPTCKRNPCHTRRNRQPPPEGYEYAFHVAACRDCGFERIIGRVTPEFLARIVCANCGSRRGYVLLRDDEIEDTSAVYPFGARMNPRHKRWQSKSHRPPRDFTCARCGEALAAPGSDLCRACLAETDTFGRCPECGRQKVFDPRFGWICAHGCDF